MPKEKISLMAYYVGKKILHRCMLSETFHLQSFWKIILILTKSPLPPQKSKG